MTGDQSASVPVVDVSVVLCFRNESVFLGCQLEALAGQVTDKRWELILVDNGSTDDSPQIARESLWRFPSAHLVREDVPGLGRARNRGASASSGAVLLFCDADDLVAPRWVDQMANAAESFDIIAGRLDCSALNGKRIRSWRRPLAEDSLAGAYGINYAVGANIGCRSSVFEELGGFDERFLSAADDIDICLRAREAGYDLGYAGDATVMYRFRDSPSESFRQFRGYGRSWAALYAKYKDSPVGSDLRWTVEVDPGEIRWLARHLPFVVMGYAKRGRWATRAGGLVGKIQGRIQYLGARRDGGWFARSA